MLRKLVSSVEGERVVDGLVEYVWPPLVAMLLLSVVDGTDIRPEVRT